MVGAIATAAAAVATIISAFIIAFQTRATARAATATAESARETGRAADATEATVLAAKKSLELAESQRRQTLFMVSEAVKTRVDASMPQFRVLADDDIEWPPLVPPSFADADPVSLRRDHEFILPRDQHLRVLIRLDVSVINDGPGAAYFRFSETLTNGQESIREAVLGPGESLSGYLYQIERTVQEWIDIYSQRRRGNSVEHQFTVTSVSPMDTGAFDTARISCGGCILEPVPSMDGHWRILADHKGSEDRLGTGTWPTERKYFLSRSANKVLPDIEWESLVYEPGRPI
jgi:hypothetical protein